MKETKLAGGIFLVILLAASCPAQQWVLKPWVEVYGTRNYDELGYFVRGLAPSPLPPLRAAVYRYGTLEYYRLNSPTDTSAELILQGENMRTGDLNGDGLLDMAVAFYNNGLYDTIRVFWGCPTGLNLETPTEFIHGPKSYGVQVSSIGDLNNDGKNDLVLACMSGKLDSGYVAIYLNPVHAGPPDYRIVGDSATWDLGTATAIGDINDDGHNDLMIRGQKSTNGAKLFDYVDIYWGGGRDTLILRKGPRLYSEQPEYPKYTLACFDITGDGVSDLIAPITKPDGHTDIFIYKGGKDFSEVPWLALPEPNIPSFGVRVGNAGDMNGDGHNDLFVSAIQATPTLGKVMVYAGGPHMDGVFDAVVSQDVQGDFGRSVDSIGDINGDGLSDIIIGAPRAKWGFDKGYWGIFLGDRRILVSVDDRREDLPPQFELEQAYPNPFNPRTTIQYNLTELAFVTLEVYDPLGRLVRTLVSAEETAGAHRVEFDGTSLASGIYFYRMIARSSSGSEMTRTQTMTLVK